MAMAPPREEFRGKVAKVGVTSHHLWYSGGRVSQQQHNKRGNWGVCRMLHDGRTLDDGDVREDRDRLFRALNRLLHAPSADARMQAEDAIRRHKTIVPEWSSDAAPVPSPGATMRTGVSVGRASRSSVSR